GPDELRVDIRISVAYGAPVAEVARQIDSAVRFAVRRAVEREIDRLTIHVGELRVDPAAKPPAPAVTERPVIAPDEADA
ncbi:MAG TPA: Asp23/Gls24 family envelope stress response protein, partial [Candidatus Limnocylindrales bacterium]|nr:Asp23/Gls24 family envelope stress response protein [Candidatus Limnocylindrales bacterium]